MKSEDINRNKKGCGNTEQLKDEEIRELIKAYYDCRLTDEEEEMLGRVLAVSKSERPEINEARALMGFRGMPKGDSETDEADRKAAKEVKRSGKHKILAWISAGAAAAVMAGAVATAFFKTSGVKEAGETADFTQENICVAFSNGKTITDEGDIIALIGETLSDFDEAREDVDELFLSELGSAAEEIDNMQNEIILPE